MGSRKTNLPRIPEPTQNNLLEVLRAMKEIIEVGVSGVKRGDPLDAYVTFRDVADGNTNSANLLGYATGATPNPGGNPGTDSPFPNPVPIGDLHLPGRPTNVRTRAVWDGIMVLWDWPENTDGKITWDRAGIWSSATSNFVDGELIGYSATDFYVHTGIGLSANPADPDAVSPGVRYYWVRFEYANPLTNELEVTEWSPYEYQAGVRGQTSVSIEWFIETFALSSQTNPELGSIYPFILGYLTEFDENGEPYNKLSVGLNGNFLVNGTVYAQAIQAGSIGAREIYAQSVWAGLMTANNVITSQFSTRDPATGDWRLEINGEGTTYENFPLWYGRGETGGEQGLFWIQRYLTLDDTYVSSLFLSGELYVTGGGKFWAGNVNFDEDGRGEPDIQSMRIEIGGPSTDFLLWAGSGLTGANPSEEPGLESNPVFFIDKMGNAVFRGTVEAEFVSGEISRTYIINDFLYKKAPKNKVKDVKQILETDWVQLSTSDWVLPEPPFATGHIPFITVSLNIYGTGARAGATRVMYKETVEAAWTEVTRHVHDISNYGGIRTITEVLPFRTHGKVWFRLDVCTFDSNTIGTEFDNPRGLLMGIR